MGPLSTANVSYTAHPASVIATKPGTGSHTSCSPEAASITTKPPLFDNLQRQSFWFHRSVRWRIHSRPRPLCNCLRFGNIVWTSWTLNPLFVRSVLGFDVWWPLKNHVFELGSCNIAMVLQPYDSFHKGTVKPVFKAKWANVGTQVEKLWDCLDPKAGSPQGGYQIFTRKLFYSSYYIRFCVCWSRTGWQSSCHILIP